MDVDVDALAFERDLVGRGEVVVGVDEVGRGALCGPLTVGALVVRGLTAPPEGLNDSKLLSAKQREALVGPLRQWASSWAVGSASAEEIDAWGLRLALAVAATRALHGLHERPTHALLDGSFNLLRAPLDVPLTAPAPPALAYANLPSTVIVKGDRRSAAIAGASVLAKVHRDEHMRVLAARLEGYDLERNKGYGAPSHLAALRRLGPSVEHRRTWRLPVSAVS